VGALADRLRRTLADGLRARADAITARCRGFGAQPGDVIAIGVRHGDDALAAWSGVVLGGFVPVFDAAAVDDVARTGERVGPDIALLQRTSGTTGAPQRLAIEHARVIAQVDGLAGALALRDGDVIASCLPLHHDMGLVSTVLLPLLCGVACVHVDPATWRADPASLLRAIEATRATLTWLPPAALDRLVRRCADAQVDLSSLRQIVCGGEVVADQTLRDFTATFGLAEHVASAGWGMAENVAAVTHTPPGRIATRLRIARSSFAPGRPIVRVETDDALVVVGVGPPIDGTEVRVGDHEQGVLGELHVRGTCRPDPTQWLATGDIGIVVDGDVFVCGRKDELLQLGDRWLPPHEVERAAATVTGVRPGRVAAITKGGVLVVIVEGDDALDSNAIEAAVVSHTGHRPRVVITAPGSLPRTTSGKLGRRACASLLDD
jgi:acyl-CoA synthetase (AMP-forming)/AMP-acid ligase II